MRIRPTTSSGSPRTVRTRQPLAARAHGPGSRDAPKIFFAACDSVSPMGPTRRIVACSAREEAVMSAFLEGSACRARGHRRRAAARCLGDGARGIRGSSLDYTTAPGRARHHHARGAHGDGDGHGVGLRPGRRLLGRAPGRRCGGHGGPHRVDADDDLHAGHGAVDRRDGHRRAAHRRARRRGRRQRGGAGDRAGRRRVGGHRRRWRLVRAGAAGADGRLARGRSRRAARSRA